MAQIHEALSEIMAEVPAIEKDRRNQQQGYQFRGIDDVYSAVHPLFVKHGVFSVPTVLEERSEERTTKNGSALIYRILRIKYDFFAKDGSSVSATVIGEGMDSGDKASNKAMAVAHKYAILQILSIPTEDEKDPENDGHDVTPRRQPEPRREQAPRPSKAEEPDPRIDLIRSTLRDICPIEEEYDALRREIWATHNGDLDAILRDLESRQLDKVGTKPAKTAREPVQEEIF